MIRLPDDWMGAPIDNTPETFADRAHWAHYANPATPVTAAPAPARVLYTVDCGPTAGTVDVPAFEYPPAPARKLAPLAYSGPSRRADIARAAARSHKTHVTRFLRRLETGRARARTSRPA